MCGMCVKIKVILGSTLLQQYDVLKGSNLDLISMWGFIFFIYIFLKKWKFNKYVYVDENMPNLIKIQLWS